MSVQFRLVHYLGILFVLHGIAVCGLCRSVQATEKDGLPESGKAEIADTEIAEAEIVDGDREHWSFQPIAQPLAPEVQSRSRLRSPIDSFVLAQLETQGLTFAPQAEPAVLLRRLKLDLVGLPPSPQELDAFLSDDRRDRYENWVDQYLASPQFAERRRRAGWIWHALRRRMDSNTIAFDPRPGSTATGLFEPSTRTCPTTALSSYSWLEICMWLLRPKRASPRCSVWPVRTCRILTNKMCVATTV